MNTATIKVPDIGGDDNVEVIEINVAIGDLVEIDQTLIVLETNKASMEIPTSQAGVVKEISLAVGDKVSEGSSIVLLETNESPAADVEEPKEAPPPGETTVNGSSLPDKEPMTTAEKSEEAVQPPEEKAEQPTNETQKTSTPAASQSGGEVYAGPAVRLMARELGVDLSLVSGSGPKNRVLKEDIQAYVNKALTEGVTGSTGSAIPAVPDIDFSAYGDIDEQPLSRIQKLTAEAMQRSWLNVPHVTHFDEADITDLEEFRALNKEKGQQQELKLTPLPFLLKACAAALREHPQFNVSLSASGENLIYKKYCHIGIAMDTPAGLMVPVIRDVDKKGIWELAREVSALGVKGQEGKLNKADLEGGCFTISSLGAIGGTGFTPIVNAPEVAILGVSKTQIKPVYIDEEFQPRNMLPLTLSYDHRAVNGVDAGQFMTCLTRMLSDIRQLLM